jgi:predicted N-acetyltransferase YhbS
VSGANPLLRPAFASDAEAVAALYSEGGQPMTARDALQRIDAASRDESGWLLVGELEGAVVALGSFTLEDGVAELGPLVVTAKRRRLGIAGALTGALENEARERGATQIVVGAAGESDEGRTFYTLRGYEPSAGRLTLSFWS